MQCGQETDILTFRILAKTAGSVSIAVFTWCEVVGNEISRRGKVILRVPVRFARLPERKLFRCPAVTRTESTAMPLARRLWKKTPVLQT